MNMPYDASVLERFFENNAGEMLAFSRDSWLPELRTSFLKLAKAIRAEDAAQVAFFTHRIRGCASMGGAHDIVASMNDVKGLADDGKWLAARGRFRDANYTLRDISTWVAEEFSHLAS